jgi:hypothetical protein
MNPVTVETILNQIAQLPPAEQRRLFRTLERQLPPKPPLDKRVPPIPMPDSTREMQWLAEHRREYANQWVALDGDRLIAHGTNHKEVDAAAKADGAYLPMVTFVEDPDRPLSVIWK